MESEQIIEATIITKLFRLLKDCGTFKRVFKGQAIKGKKVAAVLGWDGTGAPWASAIPDLIVASDNISKDTYGVFLLAIATKYFPQGQHPARNSGYWADGEHR